MANMHWRAAGLALCVALGVGVADASIPQPVAAQGFLHKLKAKVKEKAQERVDEREDEAEHQVGVER